MPIQLINGIRADGEIDVSFQGFFKVVFQSNNTLYQTKIAHYSSMRISIRNHTFCKHKA